MPNRPEALSVTVVAPDALARRIEKSLAEGGYSPAMTIAQPGGDLAGTLRESQPGMVFASSAGGSAPAAISVPASAGITELLKAVREYDRALPVVVIADPWQEEAAIEAMRAGARDYVLTDHLNRLPAVVERELREAEWRREHARFEAQLQQTQRLESIGLLAGGVAHDFNNLLTGILGNSSMALDTVPRSSPARRMLSDIIEATQRAANLTRQLLAYAGKSGILSEPLDLSDLVSEISVLLECSMPANVQLRTTLEHRLPCVAGDATQLQQLILNLVVNAAEAIGNGNGTVLITTGSQEVDETYIQQNLQGNAIAPGKYVTLEVHDSGCGMDAETKARIFEPFFTSKGTGRGLGLAAAQGIVHAHKGAIRVYTAPGQGSTFKVLLPSSDEDAVPRHVPAKNREPVARERAEVILIVDDEEIVRHTARAALQRYGYFPEIAASGEDALRIYSERGHEIALVLLDLTMPGLSGEETARGLLGINPDCSILLSSGYNESDAVRAIGPVRICGFLQKPYTAGTLAAKVRGCLDPELGARQGSSSPDAPPERREARTEGD